MMKTEKNTIRLLEAKYDDGDIVIESNGPMTAIIINGKEISHVKSITLDFRVRMLPLLTIVKGVIAEIEGEIEA